MLLLNYGSIQGFEKFELEANLGDLRWSDTTAVTSLLGTIGETTDSSMLK